MTDEADFPTRSQHKWDRYDRAVAHLTKHPEEIAEAWANPDEEKGGCLFAFVTPDGGGVLRGDGRACGCLVQIRAGPNSCPSGTGSNHNNSSVAWWPAVTHDIRNDIRLPRCSSNIEVAHLHLFARWQRRLDILRGRE